MLRTQIPSSGKFVQYKTMVLYTGFISRVLLLLLLLLLLSSYLYRAHIRKRRSQVLDHGLISMWSYAQEKPVHCFKGQYHL